MPRMTTEELAGEKLEGSWARQDAIMAARRRMKSKAAPNPNARSPDQHIEDMAARRRDEFVATVEAINSVGNYTTRCAAIGGLKNTFPEYADLAQVRVE